MKFVDEIKIKIASGSGGPGKVSFRREAMEPQGGPDGGDGGRGGDVILKVNRNLNSLVDFKMNKKYAARNGGAGAGKNQTGADGADCLLHLPPGTVVRNARGEIIVDMADINDFLILKGGRGGKGNWFFRNPVNQAPDFAQPGEAGQEEEILLELKLIADIGIIGLPNAGKSTLISRISAAKPKIANYPFTTLTPNLGVVRVGELQNFVVADIPGLIKGASSGVGLGIQFLKHIERTWGFVHMIDVSSFEPGDPFESYRDINNELQAYDESNRDREGFSPLATRPQIIVFSKIDSITPEQLEKLIRKFKEKTQITPIPISAVTGKNVEQLIKEMAKWVFEEGTVE